MERSPTRKWTTKRKESKRLTKVKALLKTARKNVSNYKANVENLKTLLQQGVKEFKAGRVKEHLSNWNHITSDPEILQNIAGAKIPFVREPQMDKIPSSLKFSSLQQEVIDLEIDKLPKKGVVKECEHENGEFISPIFVTPKKDGGYRLILNLKDLNEDVKFSHFKMETLLIF